MLGRTSTILFFIAGAILLALSTPGCGEEKKAETQAPEEVVAITTPTAAAGDLIMLIDQLKKTQMTVEVIDDGKSLGRWSQNDRGSWRLDDPSSPDTYTIYNAEKMKGWRVTGKTATEFADPSLLQIYLASSPLAVLGIYTSFAAIPRTGGATDVWEWTNVPNVGSLRIEFKGPQGLISRIVSETPTAGKSELELKYSNVGDVPDSLFELPGDVQIETAPGTGGPGDFGGAVTVPSGGGY